jgi:Fe/S biogenesis protein NfuA
MNETALQVTEAACRQLCQVRDAEKLSDVAVRLRAREEGVSFLYEFGFVREDAKQADDAVVDAQGIPIYIDPESLAHLRGATLEFVDDRTGRGFRFDNPNKPRLLENPLAVRVNTVLEERVNPMLSAHGGRVRLMDLEGDRVFLSFGGGCQGCGMVDVTLKQGVEGMLREEIAEIGEILDVTDHASGENPYYRTET